MAAEVALRLSHAPNELTAGRHRRLSGFRVWLLYLRTRRLSPAYAKRSAYFDARVFRVAWRGHDLAVKVVRSSDPRARRLLFREHVFIRALADAHVVAYRGHLHLGRRYVLVADWIEGFSLDEGAERLRRTLPANGGFDRFTQQCRGIVSCLRSAGIRHRDIREKNLMVRGGEPILFDFGWAVWNTEEGSFTPSGLERRDDAEAMEAVLRRLGAGCGEAGR